MAGTYESANIQAKVTLSTKDFQNGITRIEGQARALNTNLNSALGKGVGDGLKSSLETLKKEFASLIDESKLLKSIDENLIKLTGSFGRVSKSAGNMSKNTLTEFNKMQREATLLKDKLNTLFKTKVSNTNTMSTAEFDKINATLTKAGEQLSVFKGKTDSLVESANVTDTAFARWSGTIQEAETYLSQLKAQMNSMSVSKTAPKINTDEDINRIRANLQALSEAGHSFTLSLGEGFQRVDNSLINTNEKIARFIHYLSRTGDANLINSVANQLSTMQGKLDATNEASLRLVNTLRGMGEVTGVSIPLNGQMVELKGSMVATEESANELIMALRQLDSAQIESFNLALQNVKSNMAQIKAETEAVNQSFFKQNLSMDIEGFNNVDAFNKNLEAIERTKTQIKELIAYTKELGITPLGNLNGELVSLDENLFQSGMRANSLDETLSGMSSPQLNTVNEQLGVMKKQLSGLTADARLFKETLATINVSAFNNIPTMKTPTINTSSTDAIMKAQQGNIERVLTQINKVTTAYEQMGAKGSLSLETVDGKLIKLSSDMVRSSEGATRLREAFSRLNASQLIGLQRQLQSLSKNTDVLRGKMKLCVDTMGNIRMVSPNIEQAGKSMEKAGASSEKTKNALDSQKKSVNALDTAYGILRRTLSLIVVMFGFQLAMELFNVGKEAMDASYKIRTLGKEMGWTAQQSQKFQNQANRLQKIYPKIDMNSTAKSVAEMARVYDMTNDEATKFIETSAVFNSAMIKEGRSTEDASLALKDYLDLGQGWNRRMQEIGATKEQLVATGYWDGETQDINAQIKALDAYLQKRHYYQMAKEIYTLDEAYRALQFRIGMFIGQGLQALTPYIISAVKGFLSLLDAIEGVGNALKDNPLFQGVALFAGTVIAVGLLSKALSMLKLKIVETIASLASALVANPPLLAIAVTIGLIVTVVYELGKAWGWWKDIPSMIDKITQSLGTLQGQLVAVGTAIAGVAFYFVAKGWVTSSNTIVKAIQKVIEKLKDYIKTNKEADASDLPTGGKGKTPDLPDTKDVGWSDVGKSLRQIGLQAIKAGAYIAVGMALMAEAIILIQLPMRALASTGDYFKSDEANIRKGIDGLKLVAPTILAFAVPVTAIMIAMGYFENAFKISLGSIIKSAVAITAGMALISWAIGLLVAPMLALAVVGGATAILKGAVQEGIKGINLISEAIMALVPVVPMFAVAITAGAIIMATAEVTFGVAVVALATGMALVAVAIGTLVLPLGAIAGLGALPIDMEGVKKGAEAIKQVSIALQYLSDAMNSVASIVVADLAMKIANFFGGQGWTDLAGSMKKVEEATDSIQTVAKTLGNLSVPDINQEEIKKLGQVAEATKNIKSALDSIGGIVNQGSIESGFKIDIDDKGDISVGAIDIVKELKAKMGDINEFITAFNNIKVPAFGGNYTDKINRIKQVMEAVKQITSALKGIDGVNTSGGIVGGASWLIFGDTSPKAKFKELEAQVDAMIDFASYISGLDTGDINGEAINRIKNIASHIPSIVNSTKSVQTSLQGEVGNGIEVNQKLILIRNQISAMVNFAKMMSSLSTEGVTADSLSRINNITQNVVNIVNKLKTLRTTIGGDVGNGIDLNNKLILIRNQISAIQNFVVNVVQLGTTVDTGGVLTAIGTATTNVVNISNKLNALNTSLGANTQTGIGLNQKLTLLKNQISAIRNFVNSIGGGINGTGTAIGNITASVTALQNAISNFGKTVDGAISGLKGKGENLGNAFASGFKSKVGTIKNTVNEMKSSIGTMASYGVARADDLSVHFSTFGNRVDTAKGKVDALKGAIDSLPDNKTINIGVNIKVTGSMPWGAGLTFPSAFGLGLSGIHNTVSSGFGGVIRGIRGLKGIKTLSAPVGGGFVDAFKSVIGGMRYSHYYGSKNNGNVTDTLNSGESNCVDGALATLQLARMFGLDGKLGTTMVNGEGHAFAIIEGKIFDATAMQLLGRTKAPNVRYSASNPTQKDKKKESKKEINIIVDMTDSTFYGDEDFEKKAEKLFNRLALELLDVDKNDGV